MDETQYFSTHHTQWGRLGGHIDIVIISNLLSNISSYEPLLVLNNQFMAFMGLYVLLQGIVLLSEAIYRPEETKNL